MKSILVFLLLVKLIMSGPLAPGTWTTICVGCASLAWNPPAYWACCAGAGPLISLFSCFSEDTEVTVKSQSGMILKPLKEIQRGDFVMALNEHHQKIFAKVLFKVQTYGKFKFIRITTKNQLDEIKNLEVTSNHVMMIGNEIKKFIIAQNLKLGMKILNDSIIRLQEFELSSRTTVVTQQGTIFANGILTTTICQEAIIQNQPDQKKILQKWKKDHRQRFDSLQV